MSRKLSATRLFEVIRKTFPTFVQFSTPRNCAKMTLHRPEVGENQTFLDNSQKESNSGRHIRDTNTKHPSDHNASTLGIRRSRTLSQELGHGREYDHGGRVAERNRLRNDDSSLNGDKRSDLANDAPDVGNLSTRLSEHLG